MPLKVPILAISRPISSPVKSIFLWFLSNFTNDETKLKKPNSSGTITAIYIKSRSPPRRILDIARPNIGQIVAGREDAITKYFKPDFIYHLQDSCYFHFLLKKSTTHPYSPLDFRAEGRAPHFLEFSALNSE